MGEIKELFQCFGEVSEVNMIERGLSKTPTNSAHVVYSDEKCIERALKFEPKNNVQPFSMETETCGLVKWIKDYESLRPDVSKLQFKVDKFMEVFVMYDVFLIYRFSKKKKDWRNNLSSKVLLLMKMVLL